MECAKVDRQGVRHSPHPLTPNPPITVRTDRETERQRDRETERHRDKETERERERETERQRDRETERQRQS